VLAVAKNKDELCKEILFPSVVMVHKDSIRKKEQMAVCIRSHKRDGEITCVL
jgi:hypothetical protein